MHPQRPIILVVEDDDMTRDAVRALFEAADYGVECVATGHDATERLLRGGIDLLLLDLRLPDLDGLEICRRVRAHESELHLPIIVLTALGDEALRRAAFAAGADDYVSKPFDAAHLLDRVQVWLQSRQRLQAAHARRREQERKARSVEDQAAALATRASALHALHEVAVAASGVLDPEVLAQLAADRARDLLGTDAAALFWWDPEADVLRLLAHNDPHLSDAGKLLRPGEGSVGQAFVQRAPVVVEDFPNWEHTVPWTSIREIQTVAAVPLLVGDRPLGALVVRTYRPHQYPAEHIQLLSLLAAQVGPALEAARLYTDSERRRAEAEALATVARYGASESDPDRVLAAIAEQACRTLGGDYAWVTLLSSDQLAVRRAWWGFRTDAWRALTARAHPRLGLSARVLDEGRTVVLDHLGENPDLPAEEFPTHLREGGRTLLGTPLLSRGEMLGVLVLGWRRDVTFTSDQVRLAEALASHAAIFLDNARTRAALAEQADALHRLAAERTALIERLPSGIVVLDASGRVVLLNEAARHLWRARVDDDRPLTERVRDLEFRDAHTDRPMGPHETPGARVLAGESVQGLEYAYRLPDRGEEVWVQASGIPLRDDEGNVSGGVLMLSDVTSAHLLLRELRASEERFRLLYQSVACGVLVRSPSGEIVDANEAALAILDLPRAAVIGRHPSQFWTIFHEDGSPLAETPTQAAVRTRQPQRSVTLRFVRQDGTDCWLLTDSVPVLGPDGRVAQVVNTFIDVTERKEAERQLQAMARTEKWRALGQMASGVAHDLNQYLGLVAGHGDLALQALDRPAPDLDALRDSLRVVVQAAMDGAVTVKRLLAFARARQDGPAQRVDVGEVLSEVAKLTAPRWRDAAQQEGRPIHVQVVAEGATTIDGWPDSLREALTNLVFNAVDALPQGGTIRLGARCRRGRIEVEVADSGVGMTPDVQARVFEPFFSTKGVHGTGLGLAMVYGIVERHGGQITVESAPGIGTTFRLSFPVAAAVRTAEPDAVQAYAAGTPRHILAVDDEPALARMIALMLEPDGHKVGVAMSGEEAIERLAAERCDLVISDLGLGAGMNGWDLAAHVHAHYDGVDFILATGWGAQIDPEEARTRGVHAVVAKPYRLADLRRLIGELPAVRHQPARAATDDGLAAAGLQPAG